MANRPKYLKLTKAQKIRHYLPVFFMVVFGIIVGWSWIEIHILNTYDGVRPKEDFDLDMTFLFLIAAGLAGFEQWRRLRFTTIPYDSTENLERALAWAVVNLKWVINKKTEKMVIAQNAETWLGRSVITILIYEDVVSINSMDSQRRPYSIIPGKLNTANIDHFVQRLTDPAKHDEVLAEIENSNPLTFGQIVFRVFAYPFCLLLLYLVFVVFDALMGPIVWGIRAFILVIVGAYFYTDIKWILRHQSKKKQFDGKSKK